MKAFKTILLLAVLASCSLSGNQESELNSALSEYLEARNNGQLRDYIQTTYPDVVAYYKELGDQDFIQKFDLNRTENDQVYEDGEIQQVESDDKTIHVLYRFVAYEEEMFEVLASYQFVVAISNDDGQTWYFLDQEDYNNDHIVAPQDRLIE